MNIYKIAFLLVFSSFMACQQVSENGMPLAADFAIPTNFTELQCQSKIPEPASNLVFQSADGGQTWQDISGGLPSGTKPFLFFAGKDELMFGDDKGNYTTKTALETAKWEKESMMDQQLISVSASPSGAIAINNSGRFFKQQQDQRIWLPVFTDFKSPLVRSVFTAKDGSIFICADDGLFKSADQGKTWKHVMQDGWAFNMAESNGVLLCTNDGGILRSTDGGETWAVVLYEGGVGIAVEVVGGGFAAITYNTESETRRIRTSSDGGKTWQPIDAGLPPSANIASIKQVGGYLFCGHPEGIYRSSDWGKTWVPIFSSIGKKVFNLSVSGNVIYAVPREGGC